MEPLVLQQKNDSEQINILQITDTHLFAQPKVRLLGLNTADSFNAVVNAIIRQNLKFDFIVHTGDVSQDYSPESYRYFASVIQKLGAKKIFFIPGNHDDGPLMYRMFGQLGIDTHRQVISGNWQFIFLNSEVYGVPHGWVQREELNFLSACVNAYPSHHACVMLHHLPQLVHSDWLDTQTLHNQDEFMSYLHRLPQVKLVLCGHVHQEVDNVVNGVRFIASPSTSIQFMPNSRDFALDLRGPGWRTLSLKPFGDLETKVYRLPDNSFVPDTRASGY